MARESRDTVRRRRLTRPSGGRHRGAYVYIPAAELERAGRLEATHYTVWGTPRGGVLVRLYDSAEGGEE